MAKPLASHHSYPSGPGAPVRALDGALARLPGAAAVVLVEGISDQAAVEAAAVGLGRDLAAEGVVVVPIGGAHAIRRLVTAVGALAADARLAGLCDAREEEVFRRGLAAAGVGVPVTRSDLGALGFFVCDRDLEDELIRSLGIVAVEAVFASAGDLGAFRSLQNQPAWRGRAPEEQARRFLGSGSRRKVRYARLLAEAALAASRLPAPLEAVLRAV